MGLETTVGCPFIHFDLPLFLAEPPHSQLAPNQMNDVTLGEEHEKLFFCLFRMFSLVQFVGDLGGENSRGEGRERKKPIKEKEDSVIGARLEKAARWAMGRRKSQHAT